MGGPAGPARLGLACARRPPELERAGAVRTRLLRARGNPAFGAAASACRIHSLVVLGRPGLFPPTSLAPGLSHVAFELQSLVN